MSRGDHIKLLNEPGQPAQQPTYPHTNVQFGPVGAGFAIQILLADDIAITKAFTGQAEDELCNLLIQRRKQAKEQLAAIQHINNTKN